MKQETLEQLALTYATKTFDFSTGSPKDFSTYYEEVLNKMRCSSENFVGAIPIS